jgi:hypothetical protein
MGRHLVVIVASLAVVLTSSTAHAQGAAASLVYPQSIRSAGMGGAGEAVSWGGDLDTWANPALMGYQTGARYTRGMTQLVPGLSSDVAFTSERFAAGIGGLGWTRGRADLDYGTSTGTDPLGNPTGTFRSWEHSRFTGWGVSASRLIRGLREIHDQDRGLLARATEVADVAFGMTRKKIGIQFVPPEAEARASDWGVLLSVRLPRGQRLGALPCDAGLAWGTSVLDYDDPTVTFLNEDVMAPFMRMRRGGWAAHAAVGLPEHSRGALERVLGTWLGASFDRALSLSLAGDHERNTWGAGVGGYDVSRNGQELVLADVFHLRRGHVVDRTGEIDGTTTGWGVGLSVAGVVGYRYDEATVPQSSSSGLPDVKRHGWTAFIDPLALLGRLR